MINEVIDFGLRNLMTVGPKIISDFEVWGSKNPVIYMDDIRRKYRKRLRESTTDIKSLLQVLCGKWGQCDQIVKLTILYYANPWKNMETPLSGYAKMVSEMVSRVDKCKMEHGTMVGIHAAQSLSEKLQQATLNSFHSSGNKKAAQVGLKRLKEVLDVTKVPLQVTLGPITGLTDLSKMVSKTFGEFVTNVATENSTVVFTLSEPVDWTRGFPSSIIKHTTWDPIKNTLTVDNLGDDQKKIQGRVTSLESAVVCGVKFVNDYDEDTLYLERRKLPNGYDTMNEIFEIYPEVDFTKFKSNDFHFVETTFGIEAARRYLLDEIVMVLQKEGIGISMRHLNLLVDNMCQSGTVNANRYSSVALEESIILKSTFQQATTTFAQAAINGVVDNMQDVSSQIMLGKTPKVGVSYAHLVCKPVEQQLDEERMKNKPKDIKYFEDDDNYSECPPSPEYIPVSPASDADFMEQNNNSPEWVPNETSFVDMDMCI